MHRIRSAEPEHLAGITNIYAHAVNKLLVSWEYEAPDLEEITRRYYQRISSGYPYLVAEGSDGEVMGYAYLDAYDGRPGFRFTVEDSIYVAESCQRLGLGRALLSSLIKEATALGYRQMIAAISLPDGEGSLAFHKAFGFQKAGELKNIGWKHGQWLTAVYLQLPLGDGAQTPPDG